MFYGRILFENLMPSFAQLLSSALLALVVSGCGSMQKTEGSNDNAKPALEKTEAAAPSVDLAFLLSMNYAEAKALSGQSLELGMTVKLAAESIEVLKTDRDGTPRKVRAKGKVYLEHGFGDTAKILCQEAWLSGDEAVVRGRPILQRGGSIIEGMADDTLFYVFGTRLRVLGLHRVTNQDAMIAAPGPGMPIASAWTQGPNPLLPALDETVVPLDIRQEMQRAAEAEAVLQMNRDDALQAPAGAPAPWIKDTRP